MLSNGTEAKVGTLGSKYEFFHEWKRLSEQEEGSVALETMLRGICKKEKGNGPCLEINLENERIWRIMKLGKHKGATDRRSAPVS